MSKINYPIF